MAGLAKGQEFFSCACCGETFWRARAETMFVEVDSRNGMPCEAGLATAELRPVGPCCADLVAHSLSTPPPPEDMHRWSM